jgi:hypothetical protein
VFVLQRLGVTYPVCTDSSTDTVANHSSTWFRLIALLRLGLVKLSTFTETHETDHELEHEQSGRTFTVLFSPSRIINMSVHSTLSCHYSRYSYSSRHQILFFRVTAKSYNVATRSADPRRVKTAQNQQRSKAVLLT